MSNPLLLNQLSASLRKLVDHAITASLQSPMSSRHGAVLFSQSGRKIHNTSFNQYGNQICGFDVPAVHAEASCLKPLHDKCGRFCHKPERRVERREKWGLQQPSCLLWV